MTRGRYDIGAIRERITVGDVLAALGIEAPDGRRRIPCAIHGGADANMSVTADGQRWRCWSRCGGGDVVDLAARLRGTGTGGAIRWLAELAGLAPVRTETIAERERHQTAARRLRALRGWRSRERMRLAGVAYRAEVAAEAASAALRDPDDEAAWSALGAALRATEDADWREHVLGAADDLDLIELWRADHTTAEAVAA